MTESLLENEKLITTHTADERRSFCGSLSSLKSSDLGSIVIKESLARANLKPSDVSEVIFGQALTAMEGQNPARQASIKAGIPISVPAYSVNMLCGSGLKSVGSAYCAIKSGEGEIIVAGGQESMSQAPHAIQLRNGLKMGNGSMVDTMIFDGLTDAFTNVHMGITAENIAKNFSISRKDQDNYAAQSQQKAEVAITAGYFEKEIVPVTIKNRNETVVISLDEFPKAGTTLEGLSKLRPAFLKTDGTVTAGNASGINDGAAAVVLMSAEAAKNAGIPILGKIVAVAQAGVEPDIMGTGPIPAIRLVLEKAGWTQDQVDLYELNEAFAVQSIAVARELGLDLEKVNVNGGAIALGHPIGASGTRILVTLLHALERTKAHKGVASLCIGGGMGIAIAIERPQI